MPQGGLAAPLSGIFRRSMPYVPVALSKANCYKCGEQVASSCPNYKPQTAKACGQATGHSKTAFCCEAPGDKVEIGTISTCYNRHDFLRGEVFNAG